MTDTSYKQFCPVAMAAEILCSRWTMVLLRELVAGSTRFNELRRGVPRMSPGVWGQRWITTESSLQNLDPTRRMWDTRRNIDPTPLPRRRSTIQVIFNDLRPPRRDWWLVVH